MAKTNSLPDLDQFLESLMIESDDPADTTDVRAMFLRYARAITSDSELRLDPNVDEIIHDAQRTAIVLKATFFTEMSLRLGEPPAEANSSDDDLGAFLAVLEDGDGTTWKKSQKNKLRRFIKEAQADGKITAEEIVDFLVLTDGVGEDDGHTPRTSSINGARLLLQEHGIEPTPPRLEALALRADATTDLVAQDHEEEPEEAANKAA
ncbi:hypothetical protein FFK22_040000 [Mycobacterium sp. KBS0706]|uniref:hypothetical protein n=1 Tax=Mycobacterium sp. KBS0706 TaxID=2578109 RepID=UPI00110FDD47|nr:hypothetical protein [Mycobacterium sp. KBS0706]TSD83012.1 hypothetical protein FFK22_040000 [Mycobacterium sp. KBS0706]